MTREEAIRIIEANCSCSESKLREACAIFVPELRESEDERIRKAIVATIEQCPDDFLNPKNRDRMLAYLERQKEQKSAWNEDDEEMVEALFNCIDELQYKHGWNYVYVKNGARTIKDIPIGDVKNWLKKQKEQEPAWSEEDERILKGIIGKIDHDQTYGVSKVDMLSFLKSLRPQPKGVCKQIVHSIYKMLKGKDFYSMPSNCISLLNDIRVKCKDADECAEILDEPSWKPSEEQMEALHTAAYIPEMEFYGGLKDKLRNLYEQLKKL